MLTSRPYHDPEGFVKDWHAAKACGDHNGAALIMCESTDYAFDIADELRADGYRGIALVGTTLRVPDLPPERYLEFNDRKGVRSIGPDRTVRMA